MRLPPVIVAKLLGSQILMAAKNKHSPRLRDRREGHDAGAAGAGAGGGAGGAGGGAGGGGGGR